MPSSMLLCFCSDDFQVHFGTRASNCESLVQGEDAVPEARARYDVNVHVALGTGAFSACRIITLAPAFVLVNETGGPLELCQHGSNAITSLCEGAELPWVSIAGGDASTTLLMRPCGGAAPWCWSGRIDVAEVGENAVRISSSADPDVFIIMPVAVTIQVGRLRVYIIKAWQEGSYLGHDCCLAARLSTPGCTRAPGTQSCSLLRQPRVLL